MTPDTAGLLVAELAAGRRVIVLSASVRLSRDALETVAAAAITADLDDALVVRRAAGASRVACPRTGGQATFRSGGQGVHGMTADVVLLDDGYDPSPAVLAGVAPVLAVSGGQVVRP